MASLIPSVAGAEQDGRLALVSSGPVARRTIVLSVVLAVGVAATITTSGLVLGIIGGALVADIAVSLGNVLAASLLLMLLAATVGCVAVAAGAFTGRRGISTAAAVTSAVASYCIFSFFPLSERLSNFASVSLWHPYAGGQPLSNGLPVGHVMIFVVAIGITVALSIVGFDRRDLAN